MASEQKFFECCATAFKWDGTPTGQETTLAGVSAYVAGPANSEIAVLMIHDLFGWKFNNLRLLADYYSRELGARVYLPDYFDGEVVPENVLERPDFPDFLKGMQQRHGKEQRRDSIFATAREIRKNHGRVGAIGFCYGGWAVFQLGATEHNPPENPLVDCISTPHPSWLSREEIQAVGVPVQIQAPEFDPAFTPELKEFANKTIPTLGVPYEYAYFPGVAHGFAVKVDLKDKKGRAAMRRGMAAAVYWFRLWLKKEEE